MSLKVSKKSLPKNPEILVDAVLMTSENGETALEIPGTSEFFCGKSKYAGLILNSPIMKNKTIEEKLQYCRDRPLRMVTCRRCNKQFFTDDKRVHFCGVCHPKPGGLDPSLVDDPDFVIGLGYRSTEETLDGLELSLIPDDKVRRCDFCGGVLTGKQKRWCGEDNRCLMLFKRSPERSFLHLKLKEAQIDL